MGALWFFFIYVAMAATAIVFSALGQGGGILYTPIQLFFGVDFHVAAATSLFLIMTTSLSSTLVFRKAKVVDWTMALVLEASTAVGGFLGGLYSGHFTGKLLTYLFAGVIAFAAFFMVRQFQMESKCGGENRRFYMWHRRAGSAEYCINLVVALPVAFLAGATSGLIGVGGGVLKVPMMVLLFGVPMNIAVGSSAFMVGVTASGGFLGHLLAGHVDWKFALVLAPGIFLGSQIGARWSVGVNKDKMKIGFGYFLFALAALLVTRAALH